MSKIYRLPFLLLFGLLFSLALSSVMFFLSFKSFMVDIKLIISGSSWITIMLIFDKISISFSMVVLCISFCVFLFMCQYMENDEFKFRFGMILLLFVLSMNILIFSGSFFMLMLGWDGLGISSFALIIYYSSASSKQAGFLTLMTNRIGDVLIIASIPFFLSGGNFMFFSMEILPYWVVVLLCVAALTKSAQYPFSAWLPAAMAAPTPVSALVHSSTLVTAGVFLIIRVSMNFNLSDEICSLLIFSGGVTCFLGGVSALYENDVKKIIAFSTLSQLGLMVFCLGMNMPFLALLHLFTHAMFKAMLFLSAGLILLSSFGVQDLRILGALQFRSPLLICFFNVSSLCLMGAPFMSAFFSKHVIYEIMFMSSVNTLGVALMVVGSIFTSIYSVRLVKIISWKKISMCSINLSLTIFSYFPMIILYFMSLVSGKMFSLMDISHNIIMFTPLTVQVLLNFLLVVGILVGLMMKGERISHLFGSMLFLWPSSHNINKFMTRSMKLTTSLDLGWIEPKNILNNFYLESSFFLENLSNYMKFSLLSLFKGSAFMFMVLIMWYFF
uniref:NADH-ubiquinone oxidoreductase chain 5 n=1 Tax=Pupilla muscorum TaxID=225749 RepID=A0A0A6ZAC1_9EUPU|nr:NADH dehydrogenase subunit 5 [Pupilla muscorum]AGC52865.1 NADH dehydrogenase subunit 5 [Pupilla muscorum]